MDMKRDLPLQFKNIDYMLLGFERGKRRKLHNEEPNDFYCSLNTITRMKMGRIRWMDGMIDVRK
jgi:hypothetical protein